jgi:hypothetical protein
MIEAYAFFGAFTVQILTASVLHPAWFVRYVRVQATRFPTERLAQLYPGVDLSLARERFLTQYRTLNTSIAVLGLLLLAWLFSCMRRPDWDEGPVIVLLSVYFIVQMLPPCLVAWLGFRFNKAHKRSLLEGKRKAILQRRGLLEFISPFIVFLAVSSYFLFAAFVIYTQQRPFPGFPLIGVLTLVYALQAFVVYAALYGKKPNPLETPAGRAHSIGLIVKSCVYSCIACVVFFSLTFTLDLLDLKRWQPFAQSIFLVITALLSLMGMTAPPRQPEADGLNSSPVP